MKPDIKTKLDRARVFTYEFKSKDVVDIVREFWSLPENSIVSFVGNKLIFREDVKSESTDAKVIIRAQDKFVVAQTDIFRALLGYVGFNITDRNDKKWMPGVDAIFPSNLGDNTSFKIIASDLENYMTRDKEPTVADCLSNL